VLTASPLPGHDGREEQRCNDRVDWLSSIPFWGLHLLPRPRPHRCHRRHPSPLRLLYRAHVLITAGYHRYFSHRSFRVSRLVQSCSARRHTGAEGPLWWASHHRLHHRYATPIATSTRRTRFW